jgi:hypothetical protein
MENVDVKLYHDRNRKSFLRAFPSAIFDGFESGYFGPHYIVKKEEWQQTAKLLPKSCQVVEVKTISA